MCFKGAGRGSLGREEAGATSRSRDAGDRLSQVTRRESHVLCVSLPQPLRVLGLFPVFRHGLHLGEDWIKAGAQTWLRGRLSEGLHLEKGGTSGWDDGLSQHQTAALLAAESVWCVQVGHGFFPLLCFCLGNRTRALRPLPLHRTCADQPPSLTANMGWFSLSSKRDLPYVTLPSLEREEHLVRSSESIEKQKKESHVVFCPDF